MKLTTFNGYNYIGLRYGQGLLKNNKRKTTPGKKDLRYYIGKNR